MNARMARRDCGEPLLLEAWIGIEPMDHGFADRSLSHLGTTPDETPHRVEKAVNAELLGALSILPQHDFGQTGLALNRTEDGGRNPTAAVPSDICCQM